MSSDDAKGGSGMFAQTTRFKEAAALLNRIEAGKLPVLLSRILLNLDDSKKSEIFTEEEEEQIKETVGVNKGELSTLIAASSYIFEQGAYHNTPPKELTVELNRAGLNADQASTFGRVWQKHKDAFQEKLSKRTLGDPPSLRAMNWRLQMTMSQDAKSTTKVPNAVFHFDLGDEARDITTEMSHEQLQSFFEKLEIVQGQLDAITQ